MPSGVPTRDAALVEPTAVAYRGLIQSGAVAGLSLEIVGAGTIGLLVALVARALQVLDVGLVEIDPARAEFAASLGFSVSATARRNVPHVVDATGTSAGASIALGACADGGTVALLGLGASVSAIDLDAVVVRELQLRGSLGSPGVWPEVIDLLAQGRLTPSLLVSHTFPLHEVEAAFELVTRRPAGVRKVLVTQE
jgi:threonine dehydrogenase-like Zn-dependent dehydrogenase